MAIHKLDDETYKYLYFDKELWKGINTSEISELVSDLYPPIKFVTSKSENLDFAWLYGRVKIEGRGKVKVIYPYSAEYIKNFTLRNISFSTFPFMTLKAEGDNFKGWFAYDQFEGKNKLLSENSLLTISEKNYLNVTGFIAMF